MVGAYAGGIFTLVRLIGEHKTETVADLRALYGVSLWEVRIEELWHLVQMLTRDPRSWFHAAVAGWEYPISREWMAVTDLYDMQLASKNRTKQKPYPRPFSESKQRVGGRAKNRRRSIGDVEAILRRAIVPRDEEQ
jgi:hypothetical protein